MTCEPNPLVKQVYKCPCCHNVFSNTSDYRDHIRLPIGRDVSEYVGKMVSITDDDCSYVVSAESCCQRILCRQVRFKKDFCSFELRVLRTSYSGMLSRVEGEPPSGRSIRERTEDRIMRCLREIVEELVPESGLYEGPVECRGWTAKLLSKSEEPVDIRDLERTGYPPSVEERRMYECPLCGMRFGFRRECETHIRNCSRAEEVRKLRGCFVIGFDRPHLLFEGMVTDVSVEERRVEVKGLIMNRYSSGFTVERHTMYLNADDVRVVQHHELTDILVQRCKPMIDAAFECIAEEGPE